MEPQIRYTKTSDGVTIAYFRMGGGFPVCWMPVPPYGHVSLDWEVSEQRAVFEAVAAQMTLIRFDARGFGLSDRGHLDFSCEGIVRDIEAVFDATTSGPAVLLSVSIMSAPAILYAAAHPERVAALVLMDGLARGRDLADGWNAMVALARADWPFATQTLARAVPQYVEVSTLDAIHRCIVEGTTQEGFLEFFDAVKGWDASDSAPDVHVPVLVSHSGPQLPHVPLDACRKLAASFPNAEFTPASGAKLLDAIGDFLRRNLGSAIASGAARPPTGAAVARPAAHVRAVLFTDIVGHTEMMSRLGDARGREVLREHERITRDTLKAHGGTEVKSMGDGFMASFGSVTAAVECGVALQRAFDAQNLEPGTENLRVRVGLNAGEPIEEDGDLFGATVILASRICALAGAGEILVPETVRGLLSGKGFIFGDRGEFVPKGFDEGVRVYEVRWRP